MRVGLSNRLFLIIGALVCIVTACTLRSDRNLREENLSDRYQVSYQRPAAEEVSHTLSLGEMDGRIERLASENVLHVERWDEKKSVFVKVGTLPTGQKVLLDPSLEKGRKYRYQIEERDVSDRSVIKTEVELSIPRDHQVVSGPFSLDGKQEFTFGYFYVKALGVLLGHGQGGKGFETTGPREVYLAADVGEFEDESILRSDPKAFHDHEMDLKDAVSLTLAFRRLSGRLKVDPRLFGHRLAMPKAISVWEYQNILITTEQNAHFELLPDFSRTQVNDRSILDNLNEISGLVRYDEGEKTLVLTQKSFSPIEVTQGLFADPQGDAHTRLWFSPTSGRSYLVQFDANGLFKGSPSTESIANLNTTAGLSVDGIPLIRIRREDLTETQRRLVDVQTNVLRTDRIFARKGIRVEMGALRCKEAAYSAQQLRLLEALREHAKENSIALRALGVKQVYFDCHPYEGLYLENHVLYVGASERGNLPAEVSRLQNGLWAPRELPPEYHRIHRVKN